MKLIPLILAASLFAGMANAEDMAGMADPAMKPLMQPMDAMMKAMPMTSTGKPDADFLLMMIPHHQSAIDMAKVELAHGKDAKLLKLAEDIIKAQEAEIADMQAWLKAQGK